MAQPLPSIHEVCDRLYRAQLESESQLRQSRRSLVEPLDLSTLASSSLRCASLPCSPTSGGRVSSPFPEDMQVDVDPRSLSKFPVVKTSPREAAIWNAYALDTEISPRGLASPRGLVSPPLSSPRDSGRFSPWSMIPESATSSPRLTPTPSPRSPQVTPSPSPRCTTPSEASPLTSPRDPELQRLGFVANHSYFATPPSAFSLSNRSFPFDHESTFYSPSPSSTAEGMVRESHAYQRASLSRSAECVFQMNSRNLGYGQFARPTLQPAESHSGQSYMGLSQDGTVPPSTLSAVAEARKSVSKSQDDSQKSARQFSFVGYSSSNEPKPQQTNPTGNSSSSSSSADVNLRANAKAFVCEICGKSFSNKYYGKIHMRIHRGEKLCRCKWCNYTCCDRSNMRKHYRTHTGEKPYKCRVCGRSFAQSGSMKRHQQTHLQALLVWGNDASKETT